MGNVSLCLVPRCPMNRVVTKNKKSTLLSKTKLEERGIMSKKAEKVFLSECRQKGINIIKFYDTDQSTENFFCSYPKNIALEDLKSKYESKTTIEIKICGFHKFFKEKFESYKKQVERYDSSNPGAKKILLKDLQFFMECFFAVDYRHFFNLFQKLTEKFNPGSKLRISNLDNSKVEELMLYLNIAKLFLYQHHIKLALSENIERKNNSVTNIQSDIESCTKTFYEKIISRLVESCLGDLTSSFNLIEKNEGGEPELELKGVLFTKENYLKSLNTFLKTLVFQINFDFKEILMNDQNLEKFVVLLLGMAPDMVLMLNKTKKGKIEKERQNFIFYSVSVISSFCSILEPDLLDIKELNKPLLNAIIKNEKNLNFEILEAVIIFQFTTFSDEVRENLRLLSQYKKVAEVVEKGAKIDLSLFSGDLRPSVEKDFLLKVDEQWREDLSEGVLMLLDNYKDHMYI